MSLYKETLMKHFRNPQYKKELQNADRIKDGVNPSCGDNITLFFNKRDNLITDISFTGNGCAISMASADILCSIIKDVKEPTTIIKEFISMLTGSNITFTDELKVLEVFKELQDYPARRSCALLPWKTLESAMSE